MILSEIDPSAFGDCPVRVADREELDRRREKIELSCTTRFWPRHPFFRRLVLFGLLLTGVASAALLFTHPPEPESTICFFMPILVLILCGVMFNPRGYAYQTGIEWEEMPFEKYDHTFVPSDFMETCLMIAREYPAAIGAMVVEVSSHPDVDIAFLILVHGGEEYLIGQWGKRRENKLISELQGEANPDDSELVMEEE